MQLYNSELYISKIDSLTSSVTIVNPYFIYGPVDRHSPSMVYFELNQNSLYNNKVRPDERDVIKICDTAAALKNDSSLKFLDFFCYEYYKHYSRGTDGSLYTISLKSYTYNKKFYVDTELFRSDRFYYRYNSKLEIYFLSILLKQEFNNILDLIEYDVEMAGYGVLNEKDRLDYWLKLLPERKEELKEWEEYLHLELKKINEKAPNTK